MQNPVVTSHDAARRISGLQPEWCLLLVSARPECKTKKFWQRNAIFCFSDQDGRSATQNCDFAFEPITFGNVTSAAGLHLGTLYTANPTSLPKKAPSAELDRAPPTLSAYTDPHQTHRSSSKQNNNCLRHHAIMPHAGTGTQQLALQA